MSHIETYKSYGVEVSFESDDRELLNCVVDSLAAFFPERMERLTSERTLHHFLIRRKRDGYNVTSEFSDQDMEGDERAFIKHVRALVRVVVATNSPHLLFVHAGVVSVGGVGVVLPGDSHSGKTTLVRELVEHGAIYFSDEYAIFNGEGELLPFAKPLSIRGIDDPEMQTDVAVTAIGGTTGRTPIAASRVIFTKYREGAEWQPRQLTSGEGILKLIPHAIGFVERPDFALRILRKALENAVFLESDRGDVGVFSSEFLETLDK